MARDPKNPAGSLKTEKTGSGLLTGFLAEENAFDRRSLWRLGSWGAAAVGAITIALLVNRFSIGMHRDQVAAADLLRQSQQIQSIAKENQSEARRLASAIDTLNSDRDRLYSRITVLEQGLESVTGAIARQSTAASVQAAPSSPSKTEPQPAAPSPPAAPVVSPVATTAAPAEKPRVDAAVAEKAQPTVPPAAQGNSNALPATPATPLVASKSLIGPPDSAAGKLIEPASPANVTAAAPTPEAPKPDVPMQAVPKPEVVALATPADEAESDSSEALPKIEVQRTDFGVDVGGANSLGGLRALWRGLVKSRSNAALTTLRPIVFIKEGSNGLGMQLRLVAGPLTDAAAAARICAGMIEHERPCATTVYEGQRLTMKPEETAATELTTTKPVSAKPTWRRRSVPKRAVNNEPPKPPEPPPSTLSTLFGRR